MPDGTRPIRAPRECALSNTVIGTVASASYLGGMKALADSARTVGFPCIVVQPFDWFDELIDELYAPLPIASPPLRPRPLWCHWPYVHQFGWRRSQLYRARLWRVVAELGLDLLAMDLDHQIRMNPIGFISTVHAFRDVPEANRKAAPADVVAVWDGPAARYLNVGIMWMRSTPGTIELARRSENRSFAGWEQQIFNEARTPALELAMPCPCSRNSIQSILVCACAPCRRSPRAVRHADDA